ncbi:glycosyltransferase [Lactobacillus delbrueckii]|uniref:glycosyltransferase n=1 Tax=Lactobacillus delbrueckii TaxID=1584 RepID=UPI0037C75461
MVEQINSLQKQTFKDWHLYIRDDGSKDQTKVIAKKICKEDPRITLIDDGENLRPAKSFLRLINEVVADYYFFCDQDDYWLKDKLQVMIDDIERYDNSIPQVVYCNLKCVDQNMAPRKYSFDELIGKISGYNRFIGNDMPGCVMLFNKATRDLAVQYKPNYDDIAMHDWWIALIAQVFGQVHFVNQRMVYYRQHGDNAVGAGKSGNVIKKLFQKDLIKKQKRLVRQSFSQDMAFRKTFYSVLPSEEKRILDDMKRCLDSSIFYRFKFVTGYNFKQMSSLNYTRNSITI